jgi:hypothetical protein
MLCRVTVDQHADDVLNRTVYAIWASGYESLYAQRLQDKLKSLFPSIENHKHYVLDFVFNDPADEAAFLLWSSEGIEI